MISVIRPNKDIALMGTLVLVTLIFRLWTIMMIHTGIDERDYWYSAKAISQGTSIDYPYLNHRTIRWGVIIPVAVQQFITGTGPNAYYFMPVLNALVQTMLLYLLGRRLFNRRTAVIAVLCLIFFPYQIRAASQVRPEIFSLTYILALVYFFTGYLKLPESRQQMRSLVFSSLMLFFAYQSKITNLFFLPGFFALIVLFRPVRKVRDSLVFGGIPLIGFILETLLYAITTEYRFGHLQIISSNHLEGMEYLSSFPEMFNRYLHPYLQPYWQVPFLVFALLVLWTFFRKRDKELVFIIIPALSFFFFITFTISSLQPLKMAEPFINRYFSAVLPLVFLLISRYADLALNHLPRVYIHARQVIAVLLFGTAAFTVIFFFAGYSCQYQKVYTSSLFS